MMLRPAWDMTDSFEEDQSEKARLRLQRKSEARQRALKARRESREGLAEDCGAENQDNGSHPNSLASGSSDENSQPSKMNRRRQSWGGLSTKSSSPQPSATGNFSSSSFSKLNRRHSSGSRRQLDFDVGSNADFKANRRKSWTKSSVVEKIEEMTRRRQQRRLSSQIELQQKQAEMEEYGEWGLFAKLLNDTRKQIATNAKPEDFAPAGAALADADITVCVRKRPLNDKELEANSIDIFTRCKTHEAMVHEPVTRVDGTQDIKNSRFTFDQVFHEEEDSRKLYDCVLHEKLEYVLAGGNLTCFAYGQTGSGKTYTMTAVSDLVMDNLFSADGPTGEPLLGTELFARLSFYEIYMGKVYDLLHDRQQLRVLEDSKLNVTIKGLKAVSVSGIDGVKRLLAKGHRSRSVGVTSANADSSRSHAIVTVSLYDAPSSARSYKRKLCGQINLVDLAGSERAADTLNCDAQRAREGGDINKSLLALKECIRAMGSGSQHTPFRGSKLTQVLRQALTAEHSRTVMIATVSPSIENCEHTLNTLRYAQRLKDINAQRQYAQTAPAPQQRSRFTQSQAQRKAPVTVEEEDFAECDASTQEHESDSEPEFDEEEEDLQDDSTIAPGVSVRFLKGKYEGKEGEVVSVGTSTARVRIHTTGKTTGNVQLADLQKLVHAEEPENDDEDDDNVDFHTWVSGEDAQFTPTRALGSDSRSVSNGSHPAFDNRETLPSGSTAHAVKSGCVKAPPVAVSATTSACSSGQKLLLEALSRESSPEPKVSPESAVLQTTPAISLKGACTPAKAQKQSPRGLSASADTSISEVHEGECENEADNVDEAQAEDCNVESASPGQQSTESLISQVERLTKQEQESAAELRRLRNLLSKPSARETRMAQEVKMLRKQVVDRGAKSQRGSKKIDSSKEFKKLEDDLRTMTQRAESAEQRVASLEQQVADLEKSLKSQAASKTVSSKSAAAKITSLQKEVAGLEESLKRSSESRDDQLMLIKGLKTHRKGVSEAVKAVHDSFSGLGKATRELRGAAAQELGDFSSFVGNAMTSVVTKLQADSSSLQEVRQAYQREFRLRKRVFNQLQELRGNIRVFVRVRPMLENEVDQGFANAVNCRGEDTVALTNACTRGNKKGGAKNESHWELDQVFRPGMSNEQVYAEVEPLVMSAMDGYNVCIFAYGQTGAGKTYTMDGSAADPGVNPRALKTLFAIKEQRAAQFDISVRCSMLEIYNEAINDLLDPENSQKLSVKIGRRGNHIPGLTTREVTCPEDVTAIFQEGSHNRSIGATNMNDRSSRSHCMLSVVVESRSKLTGEVLVGRLHNIDLAGSERLTKSGAAGQRAKEAVAINKSLSALGNVIAALANKRAHVPYRDSVLTYALQSSLAGNSKVSVCESARTHAMF
eukprot:INCI4086.5.p1 GENE.INCI4086.5~~INCI4086.5.p1  ORF type:complete len:1393 (+),score=313.52 INCI4086.5:228-4406(+)